MDLPDLIDRFLRVASRYWQHHQCEQLTIETIALAKKRGEQAGCDHLLPRLLRHQRNGNSARKAMVKIGRVLTVELERHREDSSALLTLLYAVDGGGGASAAASLWSNLEVALRRIAIRCRLAATREGAANSPVQALGRGGRVAFLEVTARRGDDMASHSLPDLPDPCYRLLAYLQSNTEGWRGVRLAELPRELEDALTLCRHHGLVDDSFTPPDSPDYDPNANQRYVCINEKGNACLAAWRLKTSSANAQGQAAGKHEADSTLGQPEIASGATRETALRQLAQAVRKAYSALEYAESKKGQSLKDREAYDWLRENGIDQNEGDSGELTEYKLPPFDTWTRYVRTAREALGEQKYTPRAGRKRGRSIVGGREIEHQRGDDD